MNGDSGNRGLKRDFEEDHLNGSTNNNEVPKKQKLETESKVVHLHSLKSGTSDKELELLASKVGTVINVRSFGDGSQGLIEMDTVNSARALIDELSAGNVKAQFSTHKTLKINNNNSVQANNNNNSNYFLGGFPLVSIPDPSLLRVPSDGYNGLSELPGGGPTSGDFTPVVRVVLESYPHALSPDLVYASELGNKPGVKILKVVCFSKAGKQQALIEYDSVKSAQIIVQHFNYVKMIGPYPIRVEFSTMPSLTIKDSQERSKDYTMSQPQIESPFQQQPQQAMAGSTLVSSPFPNMERFFLPSILPLQYQIPSHMATNFPMSIPQFLNAQQPFDYAGNQDTILLVSNLNTDKVSNPDVLFILFGVYGDVQRVKILYKKKDSALIQMSDHSQCKNAISNLDKVKLYGKEIRVSFSKNKTVQLPKDGQPDVGLTKDYANSPLHRFKKPGSKNYSNIYPPSATLHLSNIPQTVSEEFLKSAFEENELVVKQFKFFPKDRKMALIELSSIEDAFDALIKMHNFKLSDASHLRVSFSKSSI